MIEGKRRGISFSRWEELPEALKEAHFVPMFAGIDLPQNLTSELSEKSDLLKKDYLFVPGANLIAAMLIQSKGAVYFLRVFTDRDEAQLRMDWVNGDKRSPHTRIHRIKHNGWVGSRLLDEILDGFRQYYLREQDNVKQVD